MSKESSLESKIHLKVKQKLKCSEYLVSDENLYTDKFENKSNNLLVYETDRHKQANRQTIT